MLDLRKLQIPPRIRLLSALAPVKAFISTERIARLDRSQTRGVKRAEIQPFLTRQFAGNRSQSFCRPAHPLKLSRLIMLGVIAVVGNGRRSNRYLPRPSCSMRLYCATHNQRIAGDEDVFSYEV